MTRLIAALVLLAALIRAPAPAHADIGGNPAGPGPCDYPFVGVTGMVNPVIGRAEWAYCRGMKEINGSRYVIALGDYVIGGGVIGPHGGSAYSASASNSSKTGYYCLTESEKTTGWHS